MEVPAGQEGTVGDNDLVVLEYRLNADDFMSQTWTADETAREQALGEVVKRLEDDYTTLSSGNDASTAVQEQFAFNLEAVLRHAVACPFRDVRERMSRLLQALAERGCHIPKPLHNSPSWFIPSRHCVKLDDPADNEAQEAMELSFAAKGRTSNLYLLMCLFPSFAQKYEELYRFVFEGTGPLPMFWRNYLAIMGASRHHCRYLIVQQEVQFYANGGDLNWLRGLSYAPLKLQRLATLNALLAHQPWLVRTSHLEALISGNEGDNWSIAELLQAVMILVMFHTLSSFSWGLGIVPEIDREGGVQGRANESPLFSPSSPAEALVDNNTTAAATAASKDVTKEIVEKLNLFQMAKMKDEDSDGGGGGGSTAKPRERSEDEMRHRQQQFDEIEQGSTTAAPKRPRRLVNYSKYWAGVDMKHSDFDVRATDYKLFRLQDYSWEDHGFSLINRYYPGVAEMLDLLFTETRSMTENNFWESHNVDTAPFREAIWYYVFRLKGMMHDDYDYAQVNQFLEKSIKAYLKNVACSPENVTQSDYNNLGVRLLDREKVHINILIMEARHQAGILYILNTLMKLKGE